MRTQCCGVMSFGQCTDCPLTVPIRPSQAILEQRASAILVRINALTENLERILSSFEGKTINYYTTKDIIETRTVLELTNINSALAEILQILKEPS